MRHSLEKAGIIKLGKNKEINRKNVSQLVKGVRPQKFHYTSINFTF